MGRRKAAKKVIKRVKPVVAKVFKCLFCNHEASVTCHLDFKSMTGELSCRVCDAKFQTSVSTLTEPVDVFSEWLDETQEKQYQELVDDEG
jgi:transcription elongation factor Elf1